MLKHFLILALMLAVPAVAAENFIFDDSIYGAREVVVDVSVDGEVRFTGSASSVTAALEYFPKAVEGQEVRQVRYDPTPASIGPETVTYSWTDPSSPVPFSHESAVRSFYNRPRIREAITHPYDVPSSVAPYLQSSEIIQVTDDIAQQASSIIGSEDDSVRIAFLLGEWVNENIEYDLNTVTEDASQTSQWVLENGYGVCDELTSLYIAMLRSQGIPARFVSGVAYTNLEGLESPWGPHGWAEVWFPDVGWVPYDVTYGQFGFVDATHITFDASVDARSNAAEYSMRGRGGELRPAGIDTDVQLVEASGGVPLYATYEVDVAVDTVGFGSANRIDVTLTNDLDSYVSTELHLAQTSRLSVDDYDRPVLLGPRESRTISWYVTVDADLESGYTYTFPVVVYTNDNQQYRSEFTARSNARGYTRQDLGYRDGSRASTALRCEYATAVDVGEEFVVMCSNDGERVCIQDVCSQDSVTYSQTFSSAGAKTLQASSDGSQRFITVLVQDEAALRTAIAGPPEVDFGGEFVINLTLTPDSQSTPTDVVATLSHPLFRQEFTVGSLAREQVVQVPVPTQYLTSGENEFTLTTNYGTSETYIVSVRADSFSEKLTLWINSLSAWVNSLFG